MSGTNNGTNDSITVRTGVVSGATTCVQATLVIAVATGARDLTVDNVNGFAVNGLAFITDGTNGEYVTVQSITGLIVRTVAGLTRGYVANSGVYGLQERQYALNTANFGAPTLVRFIDREAAPGKPVAAGITELNVQYRLINGCPNCTMVDMPSASEWTNVNAVVMTLTVRSAQKLSAQQYYQQSTTVTIQPRNMLSYRSG
jgi:hypothetical protein